MKKASELGERQWRTTVEGFSFQTNSVRSWVIGEGNEGSFSFLFLFPFSTYIALPMSVEGGEQDFSSFSLLFYITNVIRVRAAFFQLPPNNSHTNRTREQTDELREEGTGAAGLMGEWDALMYDVLVRTFHKKPSAVVLPLHFLLAPAYRAFVSRFRLGLPILRRLSIQRWEGQAGKKNRMSLLGR